MKVPPASAYLSRIASDVASSVRLPNRCAPRLSTLTSRLVAGSAPIVRYFICAPPDSNARHRVSDMKRPLSQPRKPTPGSQPNEVNSRTAECLANLCAVEQGQECPRSAPD